MPWTRLLLLTLLWTICPLHAARHDPLNDTARFLAGMSGNRKEAGMLRRTSTWKEHSRQMDDMFSYFARTRQKPIAGWRGGALKGVNSRTVFYPFGGPDYLFADAFFPKAGTYILVGLEGADPLPDLSSMSPGELAGALTNLRNSLTSVVNYSYFITKEMRTDLASTQLRGSLPPVLVFLARTGHRVSSVKLIDLSRSGSVIPRSGAGGAAPGFHIRASGKDIYYFQEDLSNSGAGSDGRLFQFVRSQGTPVTFLKSASYLMHRDSFSSIRKFILSQSGSVVSDPSGLPFRSYDPRIWKLHLYGRYEGPLELFQEFAQPDLAQAYQAKRYPVSRLPFGVGYKQSSLLVARR